MLYVESLFEETDWDDWDQHVYDSEGTKFTSSFLDFNSSL